MGSRSTMHCSATRVCSPKYRREKAWARKMVRRKERHNAKSLLRKKKYDDVDTRQTKGTQGWLTW
ncbi:hypothetical protein GS534_24095 [Rhodococcus hoagii]|nr:hypothetical protein [Prescottella equi]MBM4613737.1 hypothetical protein [Prescottella equi]NKS33112.1 hypothetical protein [Prescottella equi]